MVGGVGQRVLNGVAKKTAGLFFVAIDEVLTGSRAVTAGRPPRYRAVRLSPSNRPCRPFRSHRRRPGPVVAHSSARPHSGRRRP